MNQRRNKGRGGRLRSSSIRGGKTPSLPKRPKATPEAPPAATPTETESDSV
ncbi:hypothetical protein [Streptomyces sp. NRRL F-4489]|uniref:hypothetical protein n=1 Tax=Streptomyces sp. NRRL F-4489 TaxID=1609095 RepID=UPI000AB6D822|nr:hypothetical protein [Streptomyces sp. NRRL F-4489]